MEQTNSGFGNINDMVKAAIFNMASDKMVEKVTAVLGEQPPPLRIFVTMHALLDALDAAMDGPGGKGFVKECLTHIQTALTSFETDYVDAAK